MGIGDSGGMGRGPTSQRGLGGLTEGSSTEAMERTQARTHASALRQACESSPSFLLPTNLEGYLASQPEPPQPYRIASVHGLYSGRITLEEARDEAILRISQQAHKLGARNVVDLQHSISHGSDSVAYSLWGTAIIPLK